MAAARPGAPGAPPTPVYLSSKGRIPLYEEDDFMDEPYALQQSDWSVLLATSYARALFSSPFRVAETLIDIQYRGARAGVARPRAPEPRKPPPRREDEFDLFADNPWPAPAAFDQLSPGDANPAEAPPRATSPAPSMNSIKEGSKHFPLLEDGVNALKSIWGEENGWMVLLKGHVTQFFYNLATDLVRPALEEFLNDTFDVFDETHPATYVFSYVLVGALLSPLETARTRLIAQNPSAPTALYHNLPQTLVSIAQTEGGILGLYHPATLVPTALSQALVSSLRYTSRWVLSDKLHITPRYQPATYWALDLAFLGAETVVAAPWQLALARLRRQRYPVVNPYAPPESPEYECVVAVGPGGAPRPYTGPLNAIARVLREEGGVDGSMAVSELPPEVGVSEFLGRYLAGFASLYRSVDVAYARRVVEVLLEEGFGAAPDDMLV